MKVAYTRIKKPRRVTDDPVIYVCIPIYHYNGPITLTIARDGKDPNRWSWHI